MTENMPLPPIGIEEFHAHLDICSQCRHHPFGLCVTGATLLKAATLGPIGKTSANSLTPEYIEDKLVRALCEENGWEYGDSDEYDMAVVQVKWFMTTYTQIIIEGEKP